MTPMQATAELRRREVTALQVAKTCERHPDHQYYLGLAAGFDEALGILWEGTTQKEPAQRLFELLVAGVAEYSRLVGDPTELTLTAIAENLEAS